MAKLTGLSDYFNPGLTLGGVPGGDEVEREYTVPLASAELGLWCQMVAELAGEINSASTVDEMQAITARIDDLEPPDGDKRTMSQRTLGTVYAQMMADGVSHHHIQFCGATAYAWIVAGEDAAERYWKSGGQPGEARGPANRQERRAAGRTSTAAATGTRKRASSSGTRSQTKSSASAPAKATRGRTS